MNPSPTVQTERLTLYPLTDAEMERWAAAQADPELKQAYREMLEGCRQHPARRLWYAVWNMRPRDGSAASVGDLCFKGLAPDGRVEIGYGVKAAFEGRGYATEAVIALTRWAAAQPGVATIEAETDPDNRASQRVLEKAGFRPTGTVGAEGPRFVLCGV